MSPRKMPSGTYDAAFFHRQGFYDGYVIGKRKTRHSIGSWQHPHYERGYQEGQELREKQDRQVKRAG